ncbi:hypothetical protein CPC08DRAFT_448728 [Agrocybe pediades]|nr:hypothetical protein CPC08DRAFT_448728 [Agrocybe pediades]
MSQMHLQPPPQTPTSGSLKLKAQAQRHQLHCHPLNRLHRPWPRRLCQLRNSLSSYPIWTAVDGNADVFTRPVKDATVTQAPTTAPTLVFSRCSRGNTNSRTVPASPPPPVILFPTTMGYYPYLRLISMNVRFCRKHSSASPPSRTDIPAVLSHTGFNLICGRSCEINAYTDTYPHVDGNGMSEAR